MKNINIWVYPETISTFVGTDEAAAAAGYVKITSDEYSDILEYRKRWNNGQLVTTTAEEREAYQAAQADRAAKFAEGAEKAKQKAEINNLKTLLSETNDTAIKYADGLITEEEYAETREKRQEYRERLNELQSM